MPEVGGGRLPARTGAHQDLAHGVVPDRAEHLDGPLAGASRIDGGVQDRFDRAQRGRRWTSTAAVSGWSNTLRTRLAAYRWSAPYSASASADVMPLLGDGRFGCG
jgi:hypothetical protein